MPSTTITFTRPNPNIEFYKMDARSVNHLIRTYLESGKVSYQVTFSGQNTMIVTFTYTDTSIFEQMINDEVLHQSIIARKQYNDGFNITQTIETVD